MTQSDLSQKIDARWLERRRNAPWQILVHSDRELNTWDHPDPAFDRALYESRTISECETTYDAFSYTRGSEGLLDSANVVNWSSVSR